VSFLRSAGNEAARQIIRRVAGQSDVMTPDDQTWGEVDQALARAETGRMYASPMGAAFGWLLLLLFL
jgi:hypothetical protein